TVCSFTMCLKDILSRDSGECAICLEELEQGDTIARLPCLCIYHKGCIDEWFEVNRSCTHPQINNLCIKSLFWLRNNYHF
uniref:E3 ubiquitin-protein ligase ZNRF1 n=1 Tax=Lates calcarifer TaxID=8187 RepID=A0A4W6FQB1_LATCA